MPPITGQSTMQEVLEAYPSAQRALFRRYHMGGCSSCGYGPEDKLEEVCRNHDVTDVSEVLAFLEETASEDKRLVVSPQEVKAALAGGNPPKLLDVRLPEESAAADIAGGQPLTRELQMQMQSWNPETPIVFYCHTGVRSLDAASFFAGHGFVNARSLDGGIERWSLEIDPSVPRYELARGAGRGRVEVKPLSESFGR